MKEYLNLVTALAVCLIVVTILISGCKNEPAPVEPTITTPPAEAAPPTVLAPPTPPVEPIAPIAPPEPAGSTKPTAVPITDKSVVTGHFVMYGFGLGGQELKGTVDVKELTDGSFSVEWVINDVDWHGKGKLTEDGKFYIEYTGPDGGAGTWELMTNKEIHGKWHPEGSVNTGIEVWSRE